MTRRVVLVDGLRETVRDLERAGVELDDLKDVFGGIAAEGARVTEHNTRKGKTGKLAASARGNRAKNKAVVTLGTARVRYAGPQVYGWPARGIKPAATITRVDDVMSSTAPQMLEDGLAVIFERYGFL